MRRILTSRSIFIFVLGAAGCSSHDAFDAPQTVRSALSVASPTAAEKAFTLFESGQVRPLALEGKTLYAVNTPDNRLEIFKTSGSGLTKVGSVGVGLEPIAVAVGNN